MGETVALRREDRGYKLYFGLCLFKIVIWIVKKIEKINDKAPVFSKTYLLWEEMLKNAMPVSFFKIVNIFL